MLYTNGEHNTADVFNQVILGIKLDSTYPKSLILEMYAQVAYFGHGYYGLSDAACGYFHTTAQVLTWTQASLLAGLLAAPSDYDPITHPDLAGQRQRHVLDRLVTTGALTRTEADQITAQPWPVSGPPGHGMDPVCGAQAEKGAAPRR